MESCIRISLSEYIDPDQSQRFDHSGRNEIWREPFPPARTCDRGQRIAGGRIGDGRRCESDPLSEPSCIGMSRHFRREK